nr:Rab-GTPase-TBC domain-containing protein [Tanacetum cinerariifolium]
DKLVCWSSKKQNYVSISTAESEYVAVSSCCAQVLWMRTQLTDYGFFYDKVPIYCDSKSAITISCNWVLMRVEQEKKVTEDARAYAEQDTGVQRYATEVIQVFGRAQALDLLHDGNKCIPLEDIYKKDAEGFGGSLVLMRVEQEKKVTEDARAYAEQDTGVLRYATEVIQLKVVAALVAEIENREIMEETMYDKTLQCQSGQTKAQPSPRAQELDLLHDGNKCIPLEDIYKKDAEGFGGSLVTDIIKRKKSKQNQTKPSTK